jgi:hypothetical protein
MAAAWPREKAQLGRLMHDAYPSKSGLRTLVSLLQKAYCNVLRFCIIRAPCLIRFMCWHRGHASASWCVVLHRCCGAFWADGGMWVRRASQPQSHFCAPIKYPCDPRCDRPTNLSLELQERETTVTLWRQAIYRVTLLRHQILIHGVLFSTA